MNNKNKNRSLVIYKILINVVHGIERFLVYKFGNLLIKHGL